MNEEKDRINRESWNELASLYEEHFMKLDDYNETYDLFCAAVANENASILEVGCGPGNITQYLLKKYPAYRITATDVAPAMIDLAAKNNPSAECLVMDVREIRSLKKNFSAIVSGFCIPYLNQKDCEKFVADASAILHQRGILYLSYLEGKYEDSGFEKGSTVNIETFVHYYDPRFMEQLLNEHQFSIIAEKRFPFLRKNGQLLNQHIIIARKN